MAAIRLDMNSGETAEGRIICAQRKAAAKLQIAKSRLQRIARVKRRDRGRINGSAGRDAGIAQRRNGEGAGGQNRDQRAGGQPAAPGGLQATRLRVRGFCRSAAACSSNNSASFSVIAPPSSSASTMVTARR